MDKDAFVEHANHENQHWWFLARREIVVRLIEGLRATSRMSRPRVLEIGCGTGGNVSELATRYTCSGADISAHAIEIARQTYPESEFVAYQELGEIQDQIAGADIVLLLDVLEHVKDDFLFLSELLGRMRPGAAVLMTVPADPALWSAHDEAMYHYRRYSRDRFCAVWDRLPVDCELLSGMNWRLSPLVRFVRGLQRFLGKRSRRTDLSIPPAPLNRILTSIFAGESDKLVARLRSGYQQRSNSSAISLLAVIRRREGQIVPREKPLELPPDQYDVPQYSLGSQS